MSNPMNRQIATLVGVFVLVLVTEGGSLTSQISAEVTKHDTPSDRLEDDTPTVNPPVSTPISNPIKRVEEKVDGIDIVLEEMELLDKLTNEEIRKQRNKRSQDGVEDVDFDVGRPLKSDSAVIKAFKQWQPPEEGMREIREHPWKYSPFGKIPVPSATVQEWEDEDQLNYSGFEGAHLLPSRSKPSELLPHLPSDLHDHDFKHDACNIIPVPFLFHRVGMDGITNGIGKIPAFLILWEYDREYNELLQRNEVGKPQFISLRFVEIEHIFERMDPLLRAMIRQYAAYLRDLILTRTKHDAFHDKRKKGDPSCIRISAWGFAGLFEVTMGLFDTKVPIQADANGYPVATATTEFMNQIREAYE